MNTINNNMQNACEQLKWARKMYILKCKSGSVLEKTFYGRECLRLRKIVDLEAKNGR